MRYVSISYAIQFHLICDTFLSHMRYDSISYAIRFRLICHRFPYYIHLTPKTLQPYNLKAYLTPKNLTTLQP